MKGLQESARKLSLILAVLVVLLLVGCSRKQTTTQIDFGFAMPSSWRIVSVSQLDTNGNNEPEWVILYAFDQPGNAAFTPVGCAIYHIYRREPRLPIIYPYHLQAPSWTYLGEGEGRTSVRIQDIVTRIQPDPNQSHAATNEVIVESWNADGFVNRVSIFQWRDNVKNKLVDPNEVILAPNVKPEPGQWYQCIGLFEGTIKVDVGVDQIAVWDRLGDRSQLARISSYVPTGGPGGYLYEDNQLVAPVSSCIDFGFGMPADLLRSPYPEKLVMAFHKQFTSDPGFGSQLLTQEAQQRRKSEPRWSLFSTTSPGKAEGACVKELRYSPTTETQAEIQLFEQGGGEPLTFVETSARYKISDAETQKLWIEWELIRKGEEWKINDIRSIRPID